MTEREGTKPSVAPAARVPGCIRPVAGLDDLFDAIPDGLCILSADLVIRRINQAMAGLVARDAGDPVGRHCHEIFAQAGCPDADCLARQALDGGASSAKELFVPLPDGGSRCLELSATLLPGVDGARREVLLFARDVSAQKAAEQGLRRANQDIELLLSSIGSILVSLDGENTVTRWNRAAERMIGLTGGQTVGVAFFDLDIGWDWGPVMAAVAGCRRSGLPVRVDEVRLGTAGGERFLGLTANPVPAPEGQVPGVLILGRDITQIKVREAMATHETKMQSIGRLAAGIAHEINTPVQYVSYNAGFLEGAFADLLRLIETYRAAIGILRQGAESGDLRRRAEILDVVDQAEREADLAYLAAEIPAAVANSRKGLRQVADIVRAMRQFSHPGGGEKTFFDINATLQDVILVSRNAWKDVAEMVLDLDPGLPAVCGLPQEMGQVFLNLVINAAQAIEETRGDRVGPAGTITVRTRREDDFVTINVADTGPGIPEDIRGRVFDPFFTTKDVGKGTGQGLALVYAVVERHGGEVFFETGLGRGTVFTVKLPIDGSPGSVALSRAKE
ncbi:PAS domain-containing protein [Desulfolutivibrio sulfoxidireducens]|uniref:PAS domain-containing protein n=1 Tax=Desulfolutivibrio sulfoxidireducens TaxID=2773299 RepID=UPI001FE2A620|nr:PAS domain-containing protein [Desulfolutivibrio sulfoxidireducens]QLA17761.1 PAS domain-containing protein [Desulfolutivibrio sulfoxidireducens]QLA21337.1 PAS domain-containing protein [Desulfolutivibrio sulfoxidireducens]